MNQQNKQVLLGLGVVGLALWLAKKSRDRNMSALGELYNEEYNNGRIGRIPVGYDKFGRLNSVIAKGIRQSVRDEIRKGAIDPMDKNRVSLDTALIRAGEIVCESKVYDHIKKNHSDVLRRYGWSPKEFVMWVVENFYKVRYGSHHSILLTAELDGDEVAIALQPTDLIDDRRKNTWRVSTGLFQNHISNQRIDLWHK